MHREHGASRVLRIVHDATITSLPEVVILNRLVSWRQARLLSHPSTSSQLGMSTLSRAREANHVIASQACSGWTGVHATGRTGVSNHYFAENRQTRLETLPKPLRKDCAGRIRESFDVIEVVVVQLLAKGTTRIGYLSDIDQPARPRVDFAADVNLDTKRMTMKTTTLAAWTNVRRCVCRLESELLEYLRHR